MILSTHTAAQPFTAHVLHGLYTEVMVLADEARAYFERHQANDSIAPELAIPFSCESLKVTTRLMHSIAWLLSEKAIFAGDVEKMKIAAHDRALGYAPNSEAASVASLPAHAQYLVSESEIIYARLKRISEQILSEREQPRPLHHDFMERLQSAF